MVSGFRWKTWNQKEVSDCVLRGWWLIFRVSFRVFGISYGRNETPKKCRSRQAFENISREKSEYLTWERSVLLSARFFIKKLSRAINWMHGLQKWEENSSLFQRSFFQCFWFFRPFRILVGFPPMEFRFWVPCRVLGVYDCGPSGLACNVAVLEAIKFRHTVIRYRNGFW